MANHGNDYVDQRVPKEARRPSIDILGVWAGFIIVVGIMAVGGGLAAQVPERDFLAALFIGNAILAIFAGFAGWIGAASGKTFNALMSDVFVDRSSRLVSLYVPIILIGWFGVEAAIFGNVVGEVFSVPQAQRPWLMSGVTLLFAVSAYIGFAAIRRLSYILVPLMIVISVFAVSRALSLSGAEFAFGETTLSLDLAIAAVVSTWVMGSLTVVPDLTRYAKTPLSGALAAGLGIFFANSFTIAVGAYAAAAMREHDPALILVSIGFAPLAVIFALANIWTTNDNNMYSAAINIARMLQITRRKAVIIGAILAAIFAAFDPTSIGVLFGFLGFMGATAPALGGAVLGGYINQSIFRNFVLRSSWPAWVAWIAGSSVSFFLSGAVAIIAGFFAGWSLLTLLAIFAGKPTSEAREPDAKD